MRSVCVCGALLCNLLCRALIYAALCCVVALFECVHSVCSTMLAHRAKSTVHCAHTWRPHICTCIFMCVCVFGLEKNRRHFLLLLRRSVALARPKAKATGQTFGQLVNLAFAQQSNELVNRAVS